MHPYLEPHLGMNAAKYRECAGHREFHIGPAAWLLVARVEVELVRLDVRMVKKVAIIVEKLHRFIFVDIEFARLKRSSLLRHDVERCINRPGDASQGGEQTDQHRGLG